MKLLNAIKYFFVFLWHKLNGKLTNVELDDINDALDTAIIDRKIDIEILEAQVYAFLNENYGYKKSRFLKPRKFNGEKLKAAATVRFGARMEQLDHHLDANLKWS